MQSIGVQNGSVIKLLFVVVIWIAVSSGCAHHFALPDEQQLAVYTVDSSVDTPDSPFGHKVPVILTYGYADRFNRIGHPTAESRHGENAGIWIDTSHPTVYLMQRDFTTAKATYTNLIYRIHFPKVPYSLIPFNLTAGDNVGVLVVITLNQNHQPLLVTTVGTCGCYKAFVPTDFLPDDDLPERWPPAQTQDIYGEILPTRLVYKGIENPILLVHIRPEVHRVMDIEVVASANLHSERYFRIPLAAAPMDALQRLPMDDGGTTSFYYDKGWLKGHVKGSIKPFEMLFMSLISLDLFVGSDKVYADPAQWDNPFYTSLKPWRRDDSDMWEFARFLNYWGWRL